MQLAIYGFGGLGLEVFEIAEAINLFNKRWNKIIFIDDNKKSDQFEVLNFADFLKKKESSTLEIEVVIGVGEPVIREILYKKLIETNCSLATLIHPKSNLSGRSKIGSGVVIGYASSISHNVTLGDNVFVQPNVIIGHDVEVMNSTIISPGVCVGGNVLIGSAVFVGFNTSIKQGCNIGDHTIIGMNSSVNRNIPNGVLVVGNPARVIAKSENKRVFLEVQPNEI